MAEDKNREPSRVWFVGSGPGDPELITVKGMRLLKDAEVVIYAGSLVREKVLEWCEKGPEVHNSASMDLGAIVSLMIDASRKGKRVVRLHTGDPSLYGALREQAEALEKAGVPYGIVPGVSSAFASAAALKRELTLPGVTQTVIFTRLEGRTPVPEKERLGSLAAHGATICIFLSVSMMDEVVRELQCGYPPDTPVAVVYRASWEDELVVKGTLADIKEKVGEAGIKRQAMIIVGKAIGDDPVEQSRLYDPGFSHGFRK
ncbi:MAG: precorrin-4 C(11)-methyltransferase [Thermodesulfobacteriota bacterium]|nr:MAG: precorrin-4 C(11)-methyltransferase [Thermodesulfobacteriota bacterium]